MKNNHVIAWARHRLVRANANNRLTEKSKARKDLIKELSRQLG